MVSTNSNSLPNTYLKTIKSFVIRKRKIPDYKKELLQTNWHKYGIQYIPQNINLSDQFAVEQPLILEIGFGMGDSLIEMAKNNPTNNYIGIEVHLPGIVNCLERIVQLNLNNIKLMHHDAMEVIINMINNNSLAGIQLFFPDPWPKKKHHKRRIVQQNFVELAEIKLKSHGFIHMATDWENYAVHMLNILSNSPNLVNKTRDYTNNSGFRPLTKFENRGKILGHHIWDLYFIKK